MRVLPVLAALTHAFDSVWHNRAVALRISWLWYAILALVLIAGGQFLNERSMVDPNSPSPDVLAVRLGIVLVVLLANSSIAVTWHRYILLDELPGLVQTLRCDGMVWRYFGNTLVIMLVLIVLTMPVAFPLIFIAIATGATHLVGFASLLAIVIVSCIGFLRLGIKLPAIALGRSDFGFLDAWRASSGNAYQIAGLFLLVIAIVIAAAVSVALFGLVGGLFAATVSLVLQLIVNWFLTIFNISLLTSLYGFFVQGREF